MGFRTAATATLASIVTLASIASGFQPPVRARPLARSGSGFQSPVRARPFARSGISAAACTSTSLSATESNTSLSATESNTVEDATSMGVRGMAAAFTLFAMTTLSGPIPAGAVSGGGLDYANLDITGQDFSNDAKTYKGKDFSQVIAKGTNFQKSNLQGCRFYKAYLVNADFTGADLRGASLEDTSMDGASLKDANAAGGYFGQSLLDVKTMENADFSDAQIPFKTLPLVCARDDVKGTNPTTGVDTRDSLMCP